VALLLCIGVLVPRGPALAAETWREEELPVTYVTDVLVLGGGPSGCAAAVAAARNGAGVLLVEQYGYLGGMGTAGGVNVFMSFTHIGGVFREVMARLAECGGRRGPQFDPEMLKIVLDDMVLESGAKLLLHTKGIGVLAEPSETPTGTLQRTGWRRVRGVVIDNKSGTQIVRAKVYIDATGDGDLAAYAGASYELGRADDGLTQPMTMMFRLGGCEWTGGGIAGNPALEGYHMTVHALPNPGEVLVNMTRVSGLSGVSGEDMTQAEIEGRRQVRNAVELLRKSIPGMENAFLVATPSQIGVRETRRITGAKVVNEDDLMEGREFADVVARSSYPIDIHNPDGKGARILRPKQPYSIPYRALIPRGLSNLYVTGRCISATHEAMSAIRVQPTCYALGEAAGTAAAICVEHECGPWDMGPYLKELQTTLIEQGADLGPYGARRAGLEDVWRRSQARYEREYHLRYEPFADVPMDSPLFDAVEAVRKRGITTGVGEGRYGPEIVASNAVAAAMLGRAAEEALGAVPDDRGADLPAGLAGEWWSHELSVLVAYGAIPPAELAALQPNAACTQRQLIAWTLSLARRGGVAGLPPNDAGDEQLAEAALARGIALSEGDYRIDLGAPATRGHAVLAAAALLAMLPQQP
jgi:hypothetical protein